MKNLVITISRQYGSNGGKIAELLAKELGIPCYDREIVRLAAEKSCDNLTAMIRNDEKMKSSFIPGFSANPAQYSVLSDKYFSEQTRIIMDLARQESCVLVGRCADHLITDKSSVHIFIYAPMDVRVENIRQRYRIDTEKEAMRELKSVTADRKRYYEFYTGKRFGAPENYDLMLDSSKMEPEEAALALAAYIKVRRPDFFQR